MPPEADPSPARTQLVQQLIQSYFADERTQHLDSTFLPNRARTVEVIELLRQLMFPGFFDDHRITSHTVQVHADALVAQVHEKLYEQVRQALRYEENRTGGRGNDCENCDTEAERVTCAFLDRLPAVRKMLARDVQAVFDSDPASVSTDEAIFCYPGIDAIFTYRIAHELYRLNVPLLPRIMTEYAHNETGIDIHPGATIGESFFIDHGTGIVIGETCEIGARVKIYQGVTLGAISTKGGQRLSGRKRHPTIEDDVTIYGGAIILGGQTVVGEGSVIGGSVFITQSVPPHHTVTMKFQELEIKPRPGRKRAAAAESGDDAAHDFTI